MSDREDGDVGRAKRLLDTALAIVSLFVQGTAGAKAYCMTLVAPLLRAHEDVVRAEERKIARDWTASVPVVLLEAAEAGKREAEERVSELERRAKLLGEHLPCGGCGGPHQFDTSVPSVAWNAVIRARGLSEFLCTTCIVREFVLAGRSFTAELFDGKTKSDESVTFHTIEVRVDGQAALDAAAVQSENNDLRWKSRTLEAEVAQLKSERDVANAAYARLLDCLSSERPLAQAQRRVEELTHEREAARGGRDMEAEHRRALERRNAELERALREAQFFLSHTGNHRALVGNNFIQPSVRYERLKATLALIRTALAQGTEPKPEEKA